MNLEELFNLIKRHTHEGLETDKIDYDDLKDTPSVVPDATESIKGIIEIGTSAEIDTGTDAAKAMSPDQFAGSKRSRRGIEIQVVNITTDVDTTSGIAYINVPESLNGMNLVRAQAYVDTAGATNATTIQIRNMTKYSGNDALSTAISIASGGIVGTAGVVNASYDDVATDDFIKIYVTGNSTVKAKGLRVCLEYQTA